MQYRLIDYDNIATTIISPQNDIFPVAGVYSTTPHVYNVTYQQSNDSVPQVLATNLKSKGDAIVMAMQRIAEQTST